MATMSAHILPPLHYRLGAFDAVAPGEFTLPSPVAEHGAVLINSVVVKGETPMADLAVSVGPEQIGITHAEDQPLQVNDLRTGNSALLHPAAALILHGTRRPSIWMLDPAEGVRVDDPLTMTFFLRRVAFFTKRAHDRRQA